MAFLLSGKNSISLSPKRQQILSLTSTPLPSVQLLSLHNHCLKVSHACYTGVRLNLITYLKWFDVIILLLMFTVQLTHFV